jgi:toxin ParE1/3/4
MATVDYAPAARADIATILDDLENTVSASVALKYTEAFKHAFDHLTGFPRTGAPRPRFGREMRIWTVDPYIIYHRYTGIDDVVLVVRVVHGRRKVTKKIL